MHVSKVLEIDSSFEKSRALVVGEKIVIQGFHVKNVEQVGSDVAEIKTTEGLRHSFGKAVLGQAKSKWWQETVAKCVDKDASDGLDVDVVEKEAEGTGRMMVSLSLYPPKD